MINWRLLGLSYATTNIKEIKHAYAQQSKMIHPEEHPEEFQRLQQAYKEAMEYANIKSIKKKQEDYKDYYSELDELNKKNTSKKVELPPIEYNYDFSEKTISTQEMILRKIRFICDNWYTRNNKEIWLLLYDEKDFIEQINHKEFQLAVLSQLAKYDTLTTWTVLRLKKYITDINTLKIFEKLVDNALKDEVTLRTGYDPEFWNAVQYEVDSAVSQMRNNPRDWTYLENRFEQISKNYSKIMQAYSEKNQKFTISDETKKKLDGLSNYGSQQKDTPWGVIILIIIIIIIRCFTT